MLNIKGHADKNYDRELKSLYGSIIEMGKLVIKLTELARRSLQNSGSNFKEEAKTIDKKINKLDLSVEAQATTIMTKRQLFMDELRFMTSAIKISTSMERMGDMAKNTVKRAARLTEPLPKATLSDLVKMIDVTEKIIEGVLEILAEYDSEKAKAIWRRDDEIDEFYKKVFKSLQDDMMKNPNSVPQLTHALFAAKNLERIGDHATTLAKTIYYINSGEIMTKDVANNE